MSDGRKVPRPDLAARNTTHGMSKHQHFKVWRDMLDRCYRSANKHFKDYGARGVAVCDEWQAPETFLAWADANYRPGTTLERRDNDGPYAPGNCRFATPAEQNRNMRSNVWVTYEGDRMIFKDLVSRVGAVSYDTAKKRVSVHGWGYIEAATTPSLGRGRTRRWASLPS